MIKRGVIQLGGATPKFRISRKGVDVDTASPTDFLIHENYLVAQPFFTTFVTCPFAGYVGAASQNATVNVTLPNVSEPDPIIVLYVRTAGNFNIFPTQRRSTGAPGIGSVYSFYVTYNIVSPTSVNVIFFKQPNSQTSPNGATLIAYRRAN